MQDKELMEKAQIQALPQSENGITVMAEQEVYDTSLAAPFEGEN